MADTVNKIMDGDAQDTNSLQERISYLDIIRESLVNKVISPFNHSFKMVD